MNVGIQTYGTEGDLRPFFALAEGLQRAGHRVTLAYSSLDDRDFSQRLSGASFSHRRIGSLGMSSVELHRVVSELFADPNLVRQTNRIVERLLDPVLDSMMVAARELAATCDVLAYHVLALPTPIAAEKANKPHVAIYTAPMTPTRFHPPPASPPLGPLNWWAWQLGLWLFERTLRPMVDRLREAEHLAPLRRVRDHFERSILDLVVVSPTVFPRPPDWPERMVVSGFLTHAQPPCAFVPPPGLEEFLAGGAPPVFVTFGSMTGLERDPAAMLRIVYAAVAEAGCRAIVQADVRGSGVPEHPDVFPIGFAPHDELFPRCAAVVHHGGAGTTQSALRSGRPSIIVAHITDQFFWGQRLHRLGVGPPHLSRRTLTAHALAQSIRAALDEPRFAKQSAHVGCRMRQEDGVHEAIASLEHAVCVHRSGQRARV